MPRARAALEALETSLPQPDDGPSGDHPVVAGLRSMERRLVAAGFPAISPWWWETVERFYASGRRALVARCGRGAGKSTTACRVAVAEALYGDHPLNPGDLGVIPIFSVNRSEAADRLRVLRAILDALEEPYEAVGQTLVLARRKVEFRVYAATIAGASGFTTLFALCDEVAKWRDADTGANPATEVLASLRPTMRGRPNSHLWLISSPLGTLDAHAKAYDEGETPYQCVAFAPTWVANPTISEAQTHLEEPNEDVWRREWAAIPSEGGDEGILSPAVLDACTRPGGVLAPAHGWSYVAVMDPATRGNGWTLVVSTRDDRGRCIVVLAREWRGSRASPLKPDVVLAEIAAIVRPYGLRRVHTDQWAGDTLATVARQMPEEHRLVLIEHTITAGLKLELFDELAREMALSRVEVPTDKFLRSDLLAVRRRITPTGQGIHLPNTPDGRHTDYAMPVAIAVSEHCPGPRAVPSTPEAILEAQIEREQRRRFGQDKPSALGLRQQRMPRAMGDGLRRRKS